MTEAELKTKLEELLKLPGETEWVEFKENNYNPQQIGEYISALSNSACLHDEQYGYLVFGIENKTHNVIGTTFKPTKERKGNEELEFWLAKLLEPKIDFKIFELLHKSKRVVIFLIDASINVPIKFSGTKYIRIGSVKTNLNNYPEKERKIWEKKPPSDWSAVVCSKASINNLNQEAIEFARIQYLVEHPDRSKDLKTWSNKTFLNKAGLTIDGKVTRTAILLLGKEECQKHLSYAPQIKWILKDEAGIVKDYKILGLPFIKTTQIVFNLIRNLTYRDLYGASIFPIEMKIYEPSIIREALHNCIAHQDYEMKGIITVIESPDNLIFSNLGSFIPGSIEAVLKKDYAPKYNRNRFLSDAMVELNMIDTVGSGIRRMFEKQIERKFPLPDYDLTKPDEVKVTISGKIIDENYTQLLLNKPDLKLETVILLDKVQKKRVLTEDEYNLLKAQDLVSGKYQSFTIKSGQAVKSAKKLRATRINRKEKDKYKNTIIEFIKKNKRATRKDIDDLLIGRLSKDLSLKQKKDRIRNLLFELSKSDKTIKNEGSKTKSLWILKTKQKSRENKK